MWTCHTRLKQSWKRTSVDNPNTSLLYYSRTALNTQLFSVGREENTCWKSDEINRSIQVSVKRSYLHILSIKHTYDVYVVFPACTLSPHLRKYNIIVTTNMSKYRCNVVLHLGDMCHNDTGNYLLHIQPCLRSHGASFLLCLCFVSLIISLGEILI